MRLIKLLAAGLMAYSAYELYQLYAGGGGNSPAREADAERERIGRSGIDEGEQRREYPQSPMVEEGRVGEEFEGIDVATTDARGYTGHTRVGRGVVHRE